MASTNAGKDEVCAWIRQHFAPECTVLDVGACDGKWSKLLPEYEEMDAVEAFWPNASRIIEDYRCVYVSDVCDLYYGPYDLIIFGDVLEHMTVERAQQALRYAEEHSRCVLIGVPFRYAQDEIYGNPYERHVQDDLTEELFEERYPGYERLIRIADADVPNGYAYYIKYMEEDR